MKKEHIKNIALAVLVIMNLVLGSKILIDEKLWPSGYNFFNVENFPIFNMFLKDNKDAENFEKASHLTMPEKIIFNTGDQTTRFPLNSNNKDYSSVVGYCNEILVMALSADEGRIYEISKDEWFSSLMTKSIYLSYYTEYETELFAKFLGVRETELSKKADLFSNVVISLSDNVSVSFEDKNEDKYYRIKTGKRFEEFKNTVENIIASSAQNIEGNAINYSFDLNFDKVFGTQKAIIDSMVPIYSNTQLLPVISAYQPVDFSDDGVIDDIVHTFNVNANVARRYTEADGTMVYVENNAKLKIHTNGMIEYTATEKGIPLLDASGGHNVISEANKFIGELAKASRSNVNMYLSSPAKEGENVITFDYIAEGMPVNIYLNDKKNNAVTCVVSDGYIKEYRHILRGYKSTGEYFVTPEYIMAVDETIQKYSDVTGEITMNKLYLAYNDNGNNQNLIADWNTEVEAVILENKEGQE